jgi:hypothetical protein
MNERDKDDPATLSGLGLGDPKTLMARFGCLVMPDTDVEECTCTCAPCRHARRPAEAALEKRVRTRTLRGIGPSRPRAADCAACHVASDEPPGIDSVIAVSFGIAIVMVRGVDGAKGSLCEQHRRMVRALVNEMRGSSESKPSGRGPAW